MRRTEEREREKEREKERKREREVRGLARKGWKVTIRGKKSDNEKGMVQMGSGRDGAYRACRRHAVDGPSSKC